MVQGQIRGFRIQAAMILLEFDGSQGKSIDAYDFRRVK